MWDYSNIDATGENGWGTLCCLNGRLEKVGGSWKLVTERCEVILACLCDTIQRFGPP